MADFATPAGAGADEKKRIDDIDGELNALDDRLRSLADSADVAASDLSGDRRGGLRLLVIWAVVSVVGTVGLGFVVDDESLFPRLPLSMFAGVVIGFLAALPAIRRDKTRMNQIAESATDVADQASELRRGADLDHLRPPPLRPHRHGVGLRSSEEGSGVRKRSRRQHQDRDRRPSLGITSQNHADPAHRPIRSDRGRWTHHP